MFTTTSTISPGSRRKELLNSSGAAFPVHPGGKQAGAGLGFQPGGWSHCATPRLPSGSSNRSLISQELPNPARIKCCFQSRKELGVSSVLCKIRGCGGGAWANLLALVGSRQSTGLALELGCSGAGAEAAGCTEQRTGERRPRGKAGRPGGGDRIAGASPFPPGRGLHRHPQAPPPLQPHSRPMLTLRGPRGRCAP